MTKFQMEKHLAMRTLGVYLYSSFEFLHSIAIRPPLTSEGFICFKG